MMNKLNDKEDNNITSKQWKMCGIYTRQWKLPQSPISQHLPTFFSPRTFLLPRSLPFDQLQDYGKHMHSKKHDCQWSNRSQSLCWRINIWYLIVTKEYIPKSSSIHQIIFIECVLLIFITFLSFSKICICIDWTPKLFCLNLPETCTIVLIWSVILYLVNA